MINRVDIDNGAGLASGRNHVSRNDTTLHTMLNAIAEAVPAKVRSEITSHIQYLGGKVQPTLLNDKEAAVCLGRSKQAVRHLIFERALPVKRVGRRIHLDTRDLDAWIRRTSIEVHWFFVGSAQACLERARVHAIVKVK
jgi:excisionase family DNA binding protein